MIIFLKPTQKFVLQTFGSGLVYVTVTVVTSCHLLALSLRDVTIWRHMNSWRYLGVISTFGVVLASNLRHIGVIIMNIWRHLGVISTLASSVTVQPGSRVQNHLATAGICARVYTGVAAAVYHRLVRYLRPLPRWFELCLINLDRLEKVPTMHCFRMGPRRCLYYVQYLERQ
jgi:hypothetical protein